MASRGRIAGLVAGLLALLILPRVVPVYYTHLLILTLLYGLAAMSLDLLLGYTGLTSFGHAAYFGMGGYAVGVLTLRFHMPTPLAMVVGIAAAGVLAVLFGLLATRATEVYFIIITLALGMGLWGLAYRLVSLTGGDNGLPGIPPLDLGFGWPLRDAVALYYLVLVVVGATAAGLYRVVHSPFGLTLRGIRESESRMRMLGFNTWLHKYVAFVLAGMAGGVAGVLYAAYNGFVSPPDLHLAASAEEVLMVILGGAGTLFGPMVGAGLVVFLRNLVSAYTQRWMLILGCIFILTVLYAPQGVLGGIRAIVTRRRPSRAVGPTAAPADVAQKHVAGAGEGT
jgi:branched-chain amino acid transport system permease protein